MIDTIRQRLAAAIAAAVREETGQECGTVPVEDPPRPDMGDLASPVALQLARSSGRVPRQLAQALVARLRQMALPEVAEWSIAGPGFLNVRLDRGGALLALARGLQTPPPPPREDKVLIEHTSINPNKAAHVGHLRNACLGDTLARLFRARGHPVEVHNYIDDTGVQVADVVIGFLDLEGLDAEAVAALPEPFDYRCWDLYTQVSARLAEDEALQRRRRAVLRALEEGSGAEAAVASVVVARIVLRHLRTMGRLGIQYDLLVREGDILALDLWDEAFERLKRTDAVYRAEEGKHAGCWMMRLTGTEGFADLEEADKVLVRSNGVATYVAKDIAYHFWKYGLLERTFRYEPVPGWESVSPRHRVWQTTHRDGQEGAFGRAARAISVIDVRQSYLQAIVAQAFRLIGADRAAETFTHFAYEMVALSPRTAAALGVVADECGERAFVEMSGRRGVGVKADDLLDEITRRAIAQVAERNPGLPAEERAELGRAIAVGAVRYFLLRYTRNTVIAFDLDEALSFEGETGPYLQYAAVRAARIFDRLREREGVDGEAFVQRLLAAAENECVGGATLAGVRRRLEADDGDLWGLILSLGRFEEVLAHAERTLELAALAKYGFALAQQFSRFYHAYPILQAATADDRALRLLVAYAFRERLAGVLEVLGIPLPERM